MTILRSLHALLQARNLVQDLARVCQKGLTCRSRPHAARVASKQRGSDDVLEPSKARADRGQRQAASIGRRRHAAGFARLHEQLQVDQVNPHAGHYQVAAWAPTQ